MSRLFFFLLCLGELAALPLRAADEYLVRDGQPQAEIVIAEQPQRTVRLAVHDLRTYLEKISGARLPLVTQPTKGVPVQIYVGRSPFTDQLHITAQGLQAGAYRIVSGDHWLVLLGDDTEFVPTEPWPKNNTEIPKAQAEWDRMTGAHWGLPGVTGYKCLLTVPGDLGRPDAAPGKGEPWAFWSGDERGSFNAVTGFLQRLGVRWYMPGELGEVVPEVKSIPLPRIDETVRPDFALRSFNFRFANNRLEIAQWAMRLGTRTPSNIQIAHGLATMTNRDDIYAAHPDWFALYGGRRQTQSGGQKNQLCYSNEQLFQETVRNVRAQFDLLHYQVVSVMPPDGYTALCQCPLCAGKDTPARGEMGQLSDYVWDFVNRVAKEVGKTHPDRKVINCAYGPYALPPLRIAKLEPNVLVGLVGGRAPRFNKPEQQAEVRARREAWVAKTDNPVLIFENYPFTDRGWYLPAFTAHTMGESVNATKGYSQGEDISLTIRPDFTTVGIGLNHFLIYFTARMYWGGQEQDVDAMLREYCRLFYGPVEQEMLTFFNYCEANWQEMEKDKTKVDAALAHFATAQAKAEAGSVYGRRLALMDDFLKDLRNKSLQLGQVRGPLPQFRLARDAEGIVIDGKLDDDFWQKYPEAFAGSLRELQTGGRPTFGTTFKAAWGKDGALYLAIRCDEHPGEKLNIGATKNDDSALWYGDAVELLLETEAHSYYQIAISPSGAVADMDRAASAATRMGWDAQAQVATQIADDHWTVEIRLPVTQDENDPLHQVIGRRPSTSLPWHFNLCRQRIREQAQEYSAFSPTGKANFHEVMKFATLYEGRSHQFEAGPPEPDFLQAMQLAADFARKGKNAEALMAYQTAANLKITDFQKSAALEQLAALSWKLGPVSDLFEQLAAQIPLEPVKKAVLMQNLLDQSKAPQLVAQFSSEDLAKWPFWKAGDGYSRRGRAYALTKAGKEADADLTRALEFTSEPRTRDSIRQVLASNREINLHDDAGALAAYRAILDPVRQPGNPEQYAAVHGIARILTRQGQFDEALATLRKVDVAKTGGNYRGEVLIATGDTLVAAGRKDEARATYQRAVDDQSLDARYHKAAGEKLEASK